MDKNKKVEQVTMLKEVFTSTGVVIITRNHGLTVNKASALRKKMKSVSAEYKVAKNNLARIALEGSKYVKLKELLVGPTSISYSNDPVALAKVIAEFAKENEEKFEIVGGMMLENVMSVNEIKQLATLPSLDELRGKIIGLLQAPATKVACVLQAPVSQVARVIDAYAKKN